MPHPPPRKLRPRLIRPVQSLLLAALFSPLLVGATTTLVMLALRPFDNPTDWLAVPGIIALLSLMTIIGPLAPTEEQYNDPSRFYALGVATLAGACLIEVLRWALARRRPGRAGYDAGSNKD